MTKQRPLSNKQKQQLKGLAHHLKPVVMIGGNGLTEGVIAEIDLALTFHELIKIKLSGVDRDSKQLIVDAICRETKALSIQIIGHNLVLFRPETPSKISLVKAR